MNTSGVHFNNSGSGTAEQCLDTETEKYIANVNKHVIVTCTSFLIVIGTAGNIATYCVFRQPVYRKNVMANMFRYLSILDTALLWTSVLQMVIKGLWGVSLIHSVTSLCPYMAFWHQTLMSLANWMLVVITLTRLVHLKFPFKTKTICSQFNYNMFLVITHLYVIGVFAGILVYAQTQITDADYENISSCYTLVSRPHVQPHIFKMLYMLTNFVGPAIALIITNALIVLELRQVRARRERLLGSVHGTGTTTDSLQQGSSNNASVDGPDPGLYGSPTSREHTYDGNVHEQTSRTSRSNISKAPSWISYARSHGVDIETDNEDDGTRDAEQKSYDASHRERPNNLDTTTNSKKTGGSFESRLQSLTLMLLTASALFLVLNTPFWAIHLDIFNIETTQLLRCNARQLVFDILSVMRFSNNSINFIFYCAIGSRFRRELLALLKQCCHR